MGNFKSYKASVEELSSLIDKLEKGDISKEEIDQIKTITQDLYERSVILRYKSIEEVFKSEKQTTNPTIEKSDESLGDTANVVEGQNEESTTPPVFNFVSDDEDESKIEHDKPDEDEFSFDFSDDNDQELTEESDVDQIVSQEEELSEVEENNIIQTEVEEVSEPSSKTKITTERLTEISSDDKTVSFYEKFSQVHDESVLAMLSSQKLDSLQGAFGLNDRLQIINELFNGDSEKFAKAIETLDNLESTEEARIRLSEIAAHHQWEPDHRLVDDFAKMIERRYV